MKLWTKLVRWPAALAMLSLFGIIGLAYPASALAYSCPSSCYAGIDWAGAVNGAATEVLVNNISAPSGQRLQNEQWLIDRATSACTTNPYRSCWVEGGYTVGSVWIGYVGSPYYFWADIRPGYPYAEHDIALVPSADVGSLVSVNIDRDTGVSNQFDVAFDSPNYYGGGQSTANTMSPTDIVIGEELNGGSSGASSPLTGWNYNQWIDSGFVYHYQTADGSMVGPNNPPYGQWGVLPSQSSTGGQWQAWCC